MASNENTSSKQIPPLAKKQYTCLGYERDGTPCKKPPPLGKRFCAKCDNRRENYAKTEYTPSWDGM